MELLKAAFEAAGDMLYKAIGLYLRLLAFCYGRCSAGC